MAGDDCSPSIDVESIVDYSHNLAFSNPDAATHEVVRFALHCIAVLAMAQASSSMCAYHACRRCHAALRLGWRPLDSARTNVHSHSSRHRTS